MYSGHLKHRRRHVCPFKNSRRLLGGYSGYSDGLFVPCHATSAQWTISPHLPLSISIFWSRRRGLFQPAHSRADTKNDEGRIADVFHDGGNDIRPAVLEVRQITPSTPSKSRVHVTTGSVRCHGVCWSLSTTLSADLTQCGPSAREGWRDHRTGFERASTPVRRRL